MEFKVTLSHPEDELDGTTVAQDLYEAVASYIKWNGHKSHYDPTEWDILVEEIS